MTHYSHRSLTRLRTGDEELQTLYSEVDIYYPHTILEVAREEEQQRLNVENNVSQTMDSRHLDRPARAVDAAPDPLRWPDAKDDYKRLMGIISSSVPRTLQTEMRQLLKKHVKEVARWYHFGGYVLATADQLRAAGRMTRRIRQGVDWDGDKRFDDQRFDDLPHTELV